MQDQSLLLDHCHCLSIAEQKLDFLDAGIFHKGRTI